MEDIIINWVVRETTEQTVFVIESKIVQNLSIVARSSHDTEVCWEINLGQFSLLVGHSCLNTSSSYPEQFPCLTLLVKNLSLMLTAVRTQAVSRHTNWSLEFILILTVWPAHL